MNALHYGQHTNLPAVVWRTAVYPAKLVRGDSFVCVHDMAYMYVKSEEFTVEHGLHKIETVGRLGIYTTHVTMLFLPTVHFFWLAPLLWL